MRCSSQIRDRSREHLDLGLVGRACRILAEVGGELRQRRAARGAGQLLGARQPAADGGKARRGEAVRPRQLVDVGARAGTRRPHQLPLRLRVQVVEVHGPGGVELVLRQPAARRQLDDVEAAGDFRADDIAVVTSRPTTSQPAPASPRPSDRGEVGNLFGVRHVGPVEHRQAALIPRLDHHVAAGYRDQRAIARRSSRTASAARQLVVALNLSLIVVDQREERIGAPRRLVGIAAARLGRVAPLVREQDLRFRRC